VEVKLKEDLEESGNTGGLDDYFKRNATRRLD
jgi:hypothetical protein